MRHEAVKGVVVRVKDMGDHDRYLSVLTAEYGRITLLSKGSRSMRGEQMGISQLYSYAEFEFYRKGDRCILKGGALIRPFYELSADIDRLNLAAYLCDLTCELTDEGEEAGEMLRLLLNSLYAISRDLYPQELIKAVFELRAATVSGYAPEPHACAVCGCENSEELYLDVMNGSLLCAECMRGRERTGKPSPNSVYDDLREADVLCPLSAASHAALRYAVTAPQERIFSFEMKDENDLRLFSAAAETYVLSHIGHGFDTLQFYHSMKMPVKEQKV